VDVPTKKPAVVVRQPALFELLDETQEPLPLAVELQYDSLDPYAVTVAFLTSPPVLWTFGREVLARGLHEPAGAGDVRVSPCHDSSGTPAVSVRVRSSDGVALLRASQEDVRDFLLRTSAVVEPGTESEHLDVDAVIAAILAVETRSRRSLWDD
jgi:hypothetical protein